MKKYTNLLKKGKKKSVAVYNIDYIYIYTLRPSDPHGILETSFRVSHVVCIILSKIGVLKSYMRISYVYTLYTKYICLSYPNVGPLQIILKLY